PIRALGVPVTCLGITGSLGALAALPRLIGLLRRSKPDLVQCWMYHANLMGGLAALLAGRPKVIWGLRQSDIDPVLQKRSTVALARLGARLSRCLPDAIACVSHSAREVHAAIGYDPARLVVVPNGFDLDVFRPDAAARAELRAELGLGEATVLIGLAARFDPQKDIGNFLAAGRTVADGEPAAHFLLCGEGMDAANRELAAMIAAAGLAGRVHLLGRRSDMARVTAALDIAVNSSSFGEGFSNALGEALCCAVPAVATEVGDARIIIGEAGRIVPPRDAPALAAALLELIALGPAGRARLGALGREQMRKDYALAAIAARYRRLYDRVLVAGPVGE
ncbi:MAG: hypothetical protein RL477_1612, partial [Pseudomonadota bacterium]